MTVFISGASSGIGEALARVYAEKGHAVALFARRENRLKELADGILAKGGRALPLPGDVTVREEVLVAVRQAEATLGPIDIMIANAGIGVPNRAARFNGEKLKTTFEVNVLGAGYCFEAVIPGMVERGAGQLVGISSLAGYRGIPGSAIYSSSKTALSQLLGAMRPELKPKGIRCTTICPGFIVSEMTEQNKFKMPFLLKTDDGARRIFRAIEKKKAVHSFPWQTAFLFWLVSQLPNPIYDFIFSRVGR